MIGNIKKNINLVMAALLLPLTILIVFKLLSGTEGLPKEQFLVRALMVVGVVTLNAGFALYWLSKPPKPDANSRHLKMGKEKI